MKYTATITFNYNIQSADDEPNLGDDVVNHFSNPTHLVLSRFDYEQLINNEGLEQELDNAVSDIQGIEDLTVTLVKS